MRSLRSPDPSSLLRLAVLAAALLTSPGCSGLLKQLDLQPDDPRGEAEAAERRYDAECDAWAASLEPRWQAVADSAAVQSGDTHAAERAWDDARTAWMIDNKCQPERRWLRMRGSKSAVWREVNEAHQAKRDVVHAEANRRLVDYDARLRVALATTALEQGKPAVAQRLVSTQFNKRAKVRDEALRALAAQVAHAIDDALLASFRRFGAYGVTGRAEDDVRCIFSAEPFPRRLGAVQPIFESHIEAARTVHVLCRLPREARHYSGERSTFLIQLVSDAGAADLFHGQVEVGTPTSLGATRELRASFSLPPKGLDDGRVRMALDAQVVLKRQVGWRTVSSPAGVEEVPKWRRDVISRSGFTWHL